MCKKLLVFVLMFGLVSTAIAQPTGEIMREVWTGIGGTVVSDLTGNANYPDNPTYADLLSDFAAPVDFDDNFGSRIHGYLYPELSGDYTFWIASDDASELWLSTDDDPANAVVICSVSGWTSSQDWDGTTGAPGPNQMSAPVALEGGGKYYISALYKEGGGGDNCAVAWEGPDHPERVLLAGHHLSPAAWAPSAQKAKNPVPADGAVDVDTGILEWGSGALAVSHVVYLNGELLGETDMNLIAATLEPGVSYTWKVDEVQEDGTVIEGDTWSFTTLPLEAHFPSPADGAEDVPSPVTLRWTPGKNTIINDVYFGADEAAVAARDASTFKGKFIDASYAAGNVELFSTYYWAVDAFTPGGIVAGPVWSFSTEKYVLIEDSITLTYDNTAEPYVSEAAIDTIADLTGEGAVSDLTLNFRGMGSNLDVDEETGTYRVTGEGADIWGSSDQFHYVYMQLTGDGEISARVVSNGTGSNTWAKGGVMIRESTAANSRHMIMGMTGGDGGGIAFQGRFADTGANSSGLHGDITASPPHWVKIARTGNEISGYHSADGETWELFTDTSPDNSGGEISNPQPIEGLPDTVLIGLFVTSHADGENRTYVFDNIDLSGDLDGVIVSEDIASVSGNSAESIYVAIEDLNGAVAAVAHPYAAATQVTTNRAWTIPLSAFEGVDVTQAAKLYVGVGDGEAGGKGAVTFSDIKIVEAAPGGPKDVTAPGDIVVGVPYQPETDWNDIGWPPAENPSLCIDNNTGTKYLHFAGDIGPSGVQITPLDGPSVVTGITLTTANDAPERDPITYELYGSNDSIDGPYELIASGDVVDFAGEAAWPRYTKNATPITFANDTAYAHYQLMFPTVRDPVAQNSMQIAEIELLEGAGILAWEAAAAADSPGYLATSVAMGVYDIGTYGGEQTYEFVVNCNPDEQAVSLALIGRFMSDAGNRVALKYEQWNNLGTYGATVFGVADYDFGVANNPGVDTHLVFVSSEAAGTTELYVDGALAGSVDTAISLSGAVGIGGANRDMEGTGWVDPFDGDILGVAIYDGALTADQIAAHNDALLLVAAADAGCENILVNGNFEDGVADPWSTYGDASLEVVQDDPVEGDYCLHVTVNSAGANFWDAGLQHAGHVFEAGKSYTLSAWFKSKAGAFEINMKPERGADPWEAYGEQRIMLSEEWTEYTTNTGVIPADVDPASITFHIAFTAGEFYVDDVVFCEDE